MKIKYPIFFFSIAIFFSGCAKSEFDFCLAAERGKYGKVERMFKKEFNKRRNGTQYDNGPGSGIQTTHQYDLDTLTMWFLNQPCVEIAMWDKCEMKPMMYPGHSSIGVKFNTQKGIVEKCFRIQEGTTGTIGIFGWRPHLFKAKNKLVYKAMSDCPGFVDRQIKNCNKNK